MAMQLSEYLVNLHPMSSDSLVSTVLVKRDVSDDDVSNVSSKDRDLCEADTLMGIVLMPSTTGGEQETVGSWSRKVSGNTLTSSDKRELRLRAMALYDKWEEEWPYPSVGGVSVVYSGMEL